MSEREMDIKGLLLEINKRNIRIETKITRMVNGENDQGVTAFEYELDFVDNVWCLRVHSGGINIKQLVQLLSTEGVEAHDPVKVFVNGVYSLTIEV